MTTIIDVRDCNFRKGATAASATRITADPEDLEVGDNLAIYGGGPVATLGVPPLPTVSVPGGNNTFYMKVAYMSADRSIGVASAEFSTPDVDITKHIDLDWGLAPTIDSAARFILVWAKDGVGGAYKYMGACFANPQGHPTIANMRIGVRITGLATGRGTPWYIPATPPTTGTRGRHLTKVAAINGSTSFDLDDAMDISSGGCYPCFDATPQILSELADGKFELPAGQFMLHQDLVLDETSPRLIGQGRRIGNEQNGRVSDLHFANGFGLSLPTKNGIFRDFTVSSRAEKSLPALNLCAPRNEDALEPWVQGAGVHAGSGLHTVERLRIVGFASSGILVVAGAGGIGSNANKSVFRSVSIDDLDGHGVYCDGSDSNMNRFEGLDVVGAGGWGYFDESQFGNTCMSPHVSACKEGPYNIGGPTGSSPTVLFGSYQELGGGESRCHGQARVVGGVSANGWRGGGMILVQNQNRFLGIGSSNNGFRTILGDASNADRIQQVTGGEMSHQSMVVKKNGKDALQSYYAVSSQEGQVWYGLHRDGSGLIDFPRGVMLGENLLRILDLSQTLPNGPYRKNHIILDLDSGTLKIPAADFGIGPAWQASHAYRVGNVIVNSAVEAFVCTATAAHLGSGSGVTEPTWPGSGDVADKDVTWTFLGSGVASWA